MPEGRVETRKAMKGTKSLKTLSEVQMQPHELTRVNPHGKGHISFKMKKKKTKKRRKLERKRGHPEKGRKS